MMCLSVDIQDGRCRIAGIKKQALSSTCCDKRWAGHMEMMALSSVIGHVIYSVYPTCAPLFHDPIVPRMGTPPTSCYIMWTRDSALDNNGPFQPNHFVPLIASSEKKEPLTFAEVVKHGSLKHPTKTEETKRQECSSKSEWIPEINVHLTPFYGNNRKPNAINTAARTQTTAENPLAKRCVGEEEENEGTSAVGTSAVETPSVEEFGKGKKEKKNLRWKLAVLRIVLMKNNKRKELLRSIFHLWRNLSGQGAQKEVLQWKLPPWRNLLMKK